MNDAGDSRGVVGLIRLKFAALQRLAHRLAFCQSVPNGIGLITVGNDELSVQLENGYMTVSATQGLDKDKKNKKGRIFHCGWIKSFCFDSVFGFRENTIAAVGAAAHDEICSNGILVIGAAAQDDPSSGICIGFQ